MRRRITPRWSPGSEARNFLIGLRRPFDKPGQTLKNRYSTILCTSMDPSGAASTCLSFRNCAFRVPHVIVNGMESLGAQLVHLTRQEFLETVLRLEPQVAAFDCD